MENVQYVENLGLAAMRLNSGVSSAEYQLNVL